jgi:hypothetical protein
MPSPELARKSLGNLVQLRLSSLDGCAARRTISSRLGEILLSIEVLASSAPISGGISYAPYGVTRMLDAIDVTIAGI